jgi:hypothetical protein
MKTIHQLDSLPGPVFLVRLVTLFLVVLLFDIPAGRL